MTQPLLEVRGLKKYYAVRQGFWNRPAADIKAVDDVSFTLGRGETLGLVGESGCGKTTTARAILRAVGASGGQVLFHDGTTVRDVLRLKRRELRTFRREAQMVFQDPYASLNPRMTVEEIIAEPLVCLNIGTAAERRERVKMLLGLVGLDESFRSRYPHAFSGGQRQRICIARALAVKPQLLICDEAVSALDVSVQAQILNLLKELQAELGLTLLFVSHDLSVVEHMCDRVAVMYAGKVVELAATEDLFSAPQHPYTAALLSAVPQPDPERQLSRMVIAGEVADPAHRPPGCPFHPRCPHAQEICAVKEPPLVPLSHVPTSRAPTTQSGVGHQAACHFAETLTLPGVG